jgi:DNA modification methylase
MDGLKLIPDNEVQSIITSPPYWGLRNYHVDGQLGQEKTPEEYVENLVKVFREAKRVLRDDGTLWLNLGDSYASGGMSNPSSKSTLGGGKDLGAADYSITRKVPNGLKPKDLVGIPWLVAFALRADGWYLRMDVVWEKRNAMPESVKDRPTKAHEYVFLMSKSERYFYDHEAIKEPAICADSGRESRQRGEFGGKTKALKGREAFRAICATRNKRSVWTVSTKPFPGAHFATFPPDLIRPMILASTSEYGACGSCGAPAKRVIELGEPDLDWQRACGGDKEGKYAGQAQKDYAREGAENASEVKARILAGMRERRTVGWEPTCNCGCDPENIIPCVVLDPFGGAGTVSLVAKELLRDSIYIDIKPEYLQMAVERCDFGSSLSDSYSILPDTPDM